MKAYLSHKTSIFGKIRKSNDVPDAGISQELALAEKQVVCNPVIAVANADALNMTPETLNALDDETQSIVRTRILEGLSFEEIGQKLKITAEAVRARYNEALSIIMRTPADGYESYFPLMVSGEEEGVGDYISLERRTGDSGAYDIVDWSHGSYTTMAAFTTGIMQSLEDVLDEYGVSEIAGLDEIRIKKRVLAESEQDDIFARFFRDEDSKIIEVNRDLAEEPAVLQRAVMVHELSNYAADIYTLGTVTRGMAEVFSIYNHILYLLEVAPDEQEEFLHRIAELTGEMPESGNIALLKIYLDVLRGGEITEASLAEIVDYVRTYVPNGSEDAVLSQGAAAVSSVIDTIMMAKRTMTPIALDGNGRVTASYTLTTSDGSPITENWAALLANYPDCAWRILSQLFSRAAENSTLIPTAAETLISFISNGTVTDADASAAEDALKSIDVSKFPGYTFFAADQAFFNNFESGAHATTRGVHLPGGVVIINAGHSDLQVPNSTVNYSSITEDAHGNKVIANVVLIVGGSATSADSVTAGLDTLIINGTPYILYIKDDGSVVALKAHEFGETLLHEVTHSSYLTDLRENEESISALEDAVIEDPNWPRTITAYIETSPTSIAGIINIPAADVIINPDGTITVDVGAKTYSQVPLNGTIEVSGAECQLIMLTNGSVAVIPICTAVAEIMSDIAVDIYDGVTDNDIAIPEVREFIARLYLRLEQSRFNPAAFQTLAQTAGTAAIINFIETEAGKAAPNETLIREAITSLNAVGARGLSGLDDGPCFTSRAALKKIADVLGIFYTNASEIDGLTLGTSLVILNRNSDLDTFAGELTRAVFRAAYYDPDRRYLIDDALAALDNLTVDMLKTRLGMPHELKAAALLEELFSLNARLEEKERMKTLDAIERDDLAYLRTYFACHPAVQALSAEIGSMAYGVESGARSSANMPEWARGLNTYTVFLRQYCNTVTGRATFTELKGIFEEKAKDGWNAFLLLPLMRTDDSPYFPLSLFTLDPDYIDWSAVTDAGATPEEKFNNSRSTLSGRADYRQFVNSPYIGYIVEDAQFMALRRLRAEHSDLNDTELAQLGEFADRRDFYLYEQYIAWLQLRDATRYAHSLGLKVMFDRPFFMPCDSALTYYHPECFEWDNNGNVLHPGVWNNGTWEEWGGFAKWNFDYLADINFKPLVDADTYYVDYFGFDGMRLDAAHLGTPALWNAVKDALEGRNVLVIGEDLCDRDDLTLRYLMKESGLTLYNSTEFRRSSVVELEQAFGERAYDFYHNVSSTHDTPRMFSMYQHLAGAGLTAQEKMEALATEFALIGSDWSIVGGDEYGVTRVIQDRQPDGTVWCTVNPETDPTRTCDIRPRIGQLNNLRKENKALREIDNLVILGNDKKQEGVSSFARISHDNNVVVINNMTDRAETVTVTLPFQELGINPYRTFTLENLIDGTKIDFDVSRNVNIENSTITIDIAPGKAFIFKTEQAESDVFAPNTQFARDWVAENLLAKILPSETAAALRDRDLLVEAGGVRELAAVLSKYENNPQEIITRGVRDLAAELTAQEINRYSNVWTFDDKNGLFNITDEQWLITEAKANNYARMDKYGQGGNNYPAISFDGGKTFYSLIPPRQADTANWLTFYWLSVAKWEGVNYNIYSSAASAPALITRIGSMTDAATVAAAAQALNNVGIMGHNILEDGIYDVSQATMDKITFVIDGAHRTGLHEYTLGNGLILYADDADKRDETEGLYHAVNRTVFSKDWDESALTFTGDTGATLTSIAQLGNVTVTLTNGDTPQTLEAFEALRQLFNIPQACVENNKNPDGTPNIDKQRAYILDETLAKLSVYEDLQEEGLLSADETHKLLQLVNILSLSYSFDICRYSPSFAEFSYLRARIAYTWKNNITPGLLEAIANGDSESANLEIIANILLESDSMPDRRRAGKQLCQMRAADPEAVDLAIKDMLAKAASVGRRVEILRYSRGLTQEELASAIGVTKQAISTWEANIVSPTPYNLMSLSNYFAIEPTLIYKGKPLADALRDAGTIGERIDILRHSRGLTQEELASAIGFSDDMISSWENNVVTPLSEHLAALAAFFGIEPSLLD